MKRQNVPESGMRHWLVRAPLPPTSVIWPKFRRLKSTGVPRKPCGFPQRATSGHWATWGERSI